MRERTFGGVVFVGWYGLWCLSSVGGYAGCRKEREE